MLTRAIIDQTDKVLQLEETSQPSISSTHFDQLATVSTLRSYPSTTETSVPSSPAVIQSMMLLCIVAASIQFLKLN